MLVFLFWNRAALMASVAGNESANGSSGSKEAERPPIEPIRLPTVEEIRGQDIWNNCAMRSVVSGFMGTTKIPFYSFCVKSFHSSVWFYFLQISFFCRLWLRRKFRKSLLLLNLLIWFLSLSMRHIKLVSIFFLSLYSHFISNQQMIFRICSENDVMLSKSWLFSL